MSGVITASVSASPMRRFFASAARGPEAASSGGPRARARALSRKPPWRGAFDPSAKHRRGMLAASVSRRRQSMTPTARVRNTPFA